jgi:hypothetical protein
MDPFTQKRLLRTIEKHREERGDLPLLADLEAAGFSKSQVEWAERRGLIEQWYVTLTDGSIRKGYKVSSEGKG